VADPAKPNIQRASLLGITLGCLLASVLLAVMAARRVDQVDCSRIGPGECGFEKDVARNIAQKQWLFAAMLGAFGTAGLFLVRASRKKE
jgi:hypothetical protein